MTQVKETTLIAFHGDPAIKEKYINRLNAHRQADEIIQGVTFERHGTKSRGCAIGCTLDKYSHAAYEEELGIPRMLARLEDCIFEGLPVELSKNFPINFLSSIRIGADLTNIYKHFFTWLLTDKEHGVINYAKGDRIKKAIQDVSDLLEKSKLEVVTSEQFREVRNAAYADGAAAAGAAYAAAAYDDDAAAADVAYAAAAYAAADAAAYAAAAYAAADAAADAVAYAVAVGGVGDADVAAADAVAYAAYAAAAYAYAAYDAAYAAGVDAAGVARRTARQNKYIVMADKLIELLSAA